MNRSHQRLVVALTLLSFGALGALVACEAETGPDAPPRQNGCIDVDCKVTPTPIPFEPDASQADAS